MLQVKFLIIKKTLVMRRIIFIIGMTLGMCFCLCAKGQVKKDIWSEVSTHLSMYGSSNKHIEASYTLGCIVVM